MDDEVLIEAVNTMLTCAPGECAKESACLLGAKQVKDWLALYGEHQSVMTPEHEPDPDEVMHYAPSCWEWSGC